MEQGNQDKEIRRREGDKRGKRKRDRATDLPKIDQGWGNMTLIT